MTERTRKRPRIGDVIEIATPKGLAYAQYTHSHTDPPRYGALIRVLPGLYPSRPTAFTEIVNQCERFSVFFPLGAACNRGIVIIVGTYDIPGWARTFPVFRSEAYPIVRPESYSGPFSWWLWDGTRRWRVSELSPAQRAFPILSVWNDTMLIDRIVSNWAPADVP